MNPSSRTRSRKKKKAPSTAPRIVVLGPQTGAPTLPDVCQDLEKSGCLSADGAIATVTAGWQEREGEVGLLEAGVARPVIDLRLYARAESLSASDPELASGHRTVQNRLKELRRAYNRRLAGAMATWAELTLMKGDETILELERDDVLSGIQRLDSRHLQRVAEIRAEYLREYSPGERAGVRRERDEIAALLDGVEVVAVAGGHVATLLNRLRLFGVGELLEQKTIVAWSAGAMVLGGRIALFHDSPPWGPGNAEVFEHGLGLLDDIVFFPDASRRLDLEDLARTSRLARRFAPDTCALLDAGTRLDRTASGWMAEPGAQVLSADGSRQPFPPLAA